MPLVNGTGNSPVSGTADPGVVKQDKSSGGSVDTTKTRSDPQRVGMCSGERPIGAAKGKQTNARASCQPPPPTPNPTATPPSTPGGFPPQKAHTYAHPALPTGIPHSALMAAPPPPPLQVLQPLWRTPLQVLNVGVPRPATDGEAETRGFGGSP